MVCRKIKRVSPKKVTIRGMKYKVVAPLGKTPRLKRVYRKKR